jgi:hypothetical protein
VLVCKRRGDKVALEGGQCMLVTAMLSVKSFHLVVQLKQEGGGGQGCVWGILSAGWTCEQEQLGSQAGDCNVGHEVLHLQYVGV